MRTKERTRGIFGANTEAGPVWPRPNGQAVTELAKMLVTEKRDPAHFKELWRDPAIRFRFRAKARAILKVLGALRGARR